MIWWRSRATTASSSARSPILSPIAAAPNAWSTPVKETTIDIGNTGKWRLVVYRNMIDHVEHVAMIKGDLDGPDPVLVRMHGGDILDVLMGASNVNVLLRATEIIAEAGRGVLVLVRDGNRTSVSDRVQARIASPHETPYLRDYGVGAQILVHLGVHDMVLISNVHRTVVGLTGYDLNVVGQRAIDAVETQALTP